MSILVSSSTEVIVQGITGSMGATHAQLMLNYGTKIRAGVTPGKGGSEVAGIPVYNTVAEAVSKTSATCSVVFVPALMCQDAALEAMEAGISLLVIITEGIPPADEVRIQHRAKQLGVKVIGPNCPGIITPGECLVGIHPGSVYKPGCVGIVSRSGTLTYEVALGLTNAGIGQSTSVGIGGDPVPGLGFEDCLMMFEQDNGTELICLMGEIGGTAEENAASLIASGKIKKPVIAYFAGRTAPEGKRMGHAGAIISGDAGTIDSKERAFLAAGCKVAKTPSELIALVHTQVSSKVAA